MKIYLHSILIIILGIAGMAHAQNTLQLFDAESLETLAYAHVTVKDLSTAHKIQTISDDFGRVEIPFSNTCMIDISFVGYEPVHQEIQPGKTGIIYLFPKQTKVDEVIITAQSKETSQKESMYQVEVINKEDIEKRAAVNLTNALQNQLNFQLSNDGVLGSQVNLQGFGGSNVKIMIDGVPVIGRLDGNIDLSQINLNNIERIEVVEGPLSAIYGTNAIAGVINLITKSNQKDKVDANVKTYYESIGTYNIDGFVGFKHKKHLLQVNGGRYFFDGWNAGAYDRHVSWNPKEQYFGGLNYTLRGKKEWLHKFKSNYYQDRILNRYDPAGILPMAFDDWYYTKRIDGSYTTMGSINKNWTLNSVNSYNFYNRIKNKYLKNLSTLESTLVPDSPSNDNQDTTNFNQWMSRNIFSYTNNKEWLNIQTGVDINIENGVGGRFKDETGNAILMADAAAFVSVNFKVNDKLNIQPAIRYGYNSLFKVLPTPSVQLKYKINPKLDYRFNYGMGFRAPDLKEMYLVFVDANHSVYGNQDLTPEQSQNINTSIEYKNTKKAHNYSIKGSSFFNYKYNAIALTPNELNQFQYINVAYFSSLGFQVQSTYKWKDLQAVLGISYTGVSNSYFENQDKYFFFYPQIQANLSYTIPKCLIDINLFNKFNGARNDFKATGTDNEVQQVRIDAYNLMDVTMQRSFWKKRITVNAGIKNLFNVSNINGSDVSGAHSDNQSTQIAAGRIYFIGLKIGTGN